MSNLRKYKSLKLYEFNSSDNKQTLIVDKGELFYLISVLDNDLVLINEDSTKKISITFKELKEHWKEVF